MSAEAPGPDRSARTARVSSWRAHPLADSAGPGNAALSPVGRGNLRIAGERTFPIAPPSPASPAAVRGPEPQDRAAESYAVLFARRYLTWEAGRPQAGAQALQAFTGPGAEPDAGEVLPAAGKQRVEWAEVVQVRESGPGKRVYTVAAQTDTAGLLYLTVGVARGPVERCSSPAIRRSSGHRRPTPDPPPAVARELAEPALSTVVTRALRNYLAGSAGELAADLTSRHALRCPRPP